MPVSQLLGSFEFSQLAKQQGTVQQACPVSPKPVPFVQGFGWLGWHAQAIVSTGALAEQHALAQR